MEDEEIRDAQQQDDLVKKYALKLLKRWPYILVFFIASLLAGFAVNRYSTPVYLVKARITTKKFSNKSTSAIPGLVDASFFLSGSTEVYEEIPILKSPKRIEATIGKLDFRVSYFSEGEIKTTESLKGYGFTVNIDTVEGPNVPYGLPLYVVYLDVQHFKLEVEDESWQKAVGDRPYE